VTAAQPGAARPENELVPEEHVLVLRRELHEDWGFDFELSVDRDGGVTLSVGRLSPMRPQRPRARVESFELRRLVDAFAAAGFNQLPAMVNLLYDASSGPLRLFDHEVTWCDSGCSTVELRRLERLEAMVLDLAGIRR